MSQHAGRMRAQRLFPLHPVCAECEVTPAYDRHHWDGDATNNTLTNIVPLCRRCHMRIDGRTEQSLARIVKRPTHCLRGHPLGDDNVYLTSQGTRQCRACNRLRKRGYYQERKRG